MKNPSCVFCEENGVKREAVFLAAQSTDAGKTVTWVKICASHADGWNDGGDWAAPILPLSDGRSA